MKVLCIDPGEVHIGVAISDESGTLARPLTILRHVSRQIDSMGITELAQINQVGLIIIGIPLDSEGRVGPKARSAMRLAETMKTLTEIPIILWDESYSSQKAAEIRISSGAGRKERSKPLDDLAAAVILQDYLDAHSSEKQV